MLFNQTSKSKSARKMSISMLRAERIFKKDYNHNIRYIGWCELGMEYKQMFLARNDMILAKG